MTRYRIRGTLYLNRSMLKGITPWEQYGLSRVVSTLVSGLSLYKDRNMFLGNKLFKRI